MSMAEMFKGEVVSSGAKSSGQPCFVAVNGVVTIQLPEVEEKFVLPLINGLKVCNAFEGTNGRVHELCGQPYNYVVEHIYKNVFTEELSKARLATCIYAQQIAKAHEDPASRQKITQSPETKQTLLLKALFNRGFFLAPRWVYMI